jgi:N6-L-threonylcarbamoyladenine synthase
MLKLKQAARDTGISTIAVAGGVSANSGLRQALLHAAAKHNWEMHIPPFKYTTDNAAMIAITGYFKYLKGEFATHDAVPYSRVTLK